jgi:colanic acid biosynthesis glycosyl transferase WcaI
VGDGSSKDRLTQEVQKKHLANIHFFPLQPYQKLPRLLAMADVHLVLQKKTASDLVLPSKLTSILSIGGVSIATATKHSYLYQVFEAFKLGIITPPEDGKALSDAIAKCFLLEEPTNQYKTNALSFAENFLHKEKILSQFEQTLKQIALK